MTRLLRLIATVFLAAVSMAAGAQIVTDSLERVDTDSVRRAFDRGPYFGLYKDNYFIFGTAVNHTPTKTNTDIKFQISIQQRLTRSTLPFGTYLYLFYSQKCWWNVLENSMPMVDLNFNPGIGLAKPLFVKNRYVGKATLMAEHESNGRDGLASRSWNKISLAASIMIDPQVTVHGKVWIPIVDGQNNRDILDYSGIYQVGTEFTSRNRRFTASVVLVKRRGWKLNYNTIIELGYRIFRRDNQFLFLQFYNGYGECMLDYNQFRSRVRFGIVIKPRLFSEY